MKRMTGFTLVLMLCVVGFSFGQEEEGKNYISKGGWLVGGSFSLSYSGSIHNSIHVNPMGGYFIGEKTVVGLSTGFYSGNAVSGFYAQPFLRYYLTQKRLAPFGEIAFGAGRTRYETIHPIYKVGVGLDYFITKNVALEGNLQYYHNANLTSGNTISDGINLNIGLQLFIR